jgi:ribosomal protein S18 acetylase RimI-like enzyme
MSSEGIDIRGFDIKYKDKMVELYLRAYRGLELYAYKGVEDTGSYIDWLVKRDREGILLAFEGERLVGFIAADANWFSKREKDRVGAIHELVIEEGYRGKGIATLLMNMALEYFKRKGLKKAELWVGDENFIAQKFYRGFGFYESGRYNYWIRMVKDLKGDT